MSFVRLKTWYVDCLTREHALLLTAACVAILALNFPLPPSQWPSFQWSSGFAARDEAEIDSALQQAANTALDGREGSIIVMDPQTGRIRALVNPRLAFEQPLMPGSTMKPFTALAALRAGLIDKASRTVCPGRFTGRSFSLPCVHEDHLPPFTPAQAIAYSCNYYFATLGQRLGRDKLIDTLRDFGFGQPTAMAEEAGTLRPCETGTTARIRESDHAARQSDCDAREAIGESDQIQVTPIQLLTAYAALVNGGHLWEPRAANASNFQPVERSRIEISPQHREIIIEGMRGAVRYGTAKHAQLASLPFDVLGKTGTSNPPKGFRSNGWFVGFASTRAENSSASEMTPDSSAMNLAVLVLISRSHGAEGAALAKPVFEALANETVNVHRGGAERRRDGAETNPSNSTIRNPKSEVIKVHLVTENATMEMPLEDYVLGVMRAEGSMETEPEALKALAIGIRTYALKNRRRHAKDGYDFCTTTHCQRFVVATNRDTSLTIREGSLLAAVKATEGQVLLADRGQLVDSYFGASCGGETANIGALWGKNPPPYLRGVHDEFCLTGAHANWTDTISCADLLRALQSDPRTNLGSRIDQVVVSKRDETGRAEFVTLEGEHRKVVRGWDFKIIVGRVLGWNILKSSRFEVARNGSDFVFRGSGFGHGLGLCQEGAHVMAERGANYQRILEKYFPGTRVGRTDRVEAGRRDLTAEGAEVIAEGTEENLGVPLRRTPRPLRLNAFFGHASTSNQRYLTISSEHFRVTYPADVDRRDANSALNILETARADYLHRASAASTALSDIPTLEIRLNQSTGDFTARTGQPWWAAAATKGNRIELQPIAVLTRRGVLTTTLRHELAHAVIDAVSRDRAPRWLAEGFAIYLAGEGPTISRYLIKTKLTSDELERRLERPSSQREMRVAYAMAYQTVAETIRTKGEAAMWKRLAA